MYVGDVDSPGWDVPGFWSSRSFLNFPKFGKLREIPERNSRTRPIFKLVKNRSRKRLLPIIRKYVKPESSVISDCWGAYSDLSRNGYIHYQVNHQTHFVNPGSGAHTQHIECAWRNYKEDIYRYKGNLREKALKMNLRFIEWNHWLARDHRAGILGRLSKDIRACYKV